MSAERIDHAAESQKIWDHVGEQFISDEGWTEATAIMGVLDSVRHAVLALVEQQRIANLLKLYDVETEAGHGALFVTADEKAWATYVLRPDIREALGLS